MFHNFFFSSNNLENSGHIVRLLKILSQHDTEAHFIPTLSKFDPEAASDVAASNIGTEASNTLTYYFQAVCSIYLISLSGKRPIVHDARSYCSHLFVRE